MISSTLAVPSWISVDSSSGLLTVSAPQVASDTEYDFYIDSVVQGIATSIKKLIKLTIKNWVVANCKVWSASSTSTCAACSSGYTLKTGLWVNSDYIQADTAAALSTTMQSLVGATAAIVVVSSLLNTSSMSSLWSMINQIQMFFLLLLTRAYLPDCVKTAITGSKLAVDVSGFVPFDHFRFYKSAIDNFDFELSFATLDLVGIKSDSTVYNASSLVVLAMLMSVLHAAVLVLDRLAVRCHPIRWSWLVNLVRWVIHKVFLIMTFGFYIRTILEASQYLLISSTYEVYKFNTTHPLRIVSLVAAFAVLVAMLALLALTTYLAWSKYKVDESKHNKLEELFSGLKPNKSNRLYAALVLARRTIFVVLLITMVSVSSRLVIGVMTAQQICYLVWLCCLRPWAEVKSNLIEVINELYFSALLGSLLFMNTEAEWSSTTASIYMWTIASNSMVLFTIVLSKCFSDRCSWHCEKNCKMSLSKII